MNERTNIRHHSPWERGLGRTLLMWFLVVSLVPLAMVSLLSYSNANKGLRQGVLESLAAVTGIKTEYINSHFARLLTDLRGQAESTSNAELLKQLRRARAESGLSLQAFVVSEAWSEISDEHAGDMRAFRGLHGVHDVLLLDASGDVLFTVLKEGDLGENLFRGRYADTLLASACRRCLESGKPTFSDFEFYAPSNGAIAGFLVAPVVDDGGDALGLLVLQIPVVEIDHIMQMSNGLGRTGRSYLIGEDLAMRSNLAKSDRDTILHAIVDTEQSRLWLRAHVGENRPLRCPEEVPYSYVGYLGNRVIGTHATLSIAGVRMGLIAEIEEHEAFAPVARQRNVAIATGLLALLVVIVSASLATRSIVDPIHALHEGTEIIGEGNLDHRVGTKSQNEIGQLSRAFDKMVTDLRSTMASRDELNTEVLQRRRVEEELARSNRELEQFGYSASHDLQEPLRKIIAFSDRVAVRCKDQLDEKYLDYLARVQSAAMRMQALIDGLLAYSRVTTKAKPFESVDLSATIEGVLQDLELRISDTGGEVRVRDLPTLDAEPMQMRQLLQNLIGNALKFQREGVPPLIDVSGESIPASGENPEMCRITVGDNGIGFEPKFADRIFQVFQRLHGRGTYEGTGIGLALCKKIVDRHGGAIVADSKPGEGTVFTVTLPKRQAAPVSESDEEIEKG